MSRYLEAKILELLKYLHKSLPDAEYEKLKDFEGAEEDRQHVFEELCRAKAEHEEEKTRINKWYRRMTRK